MGKKKSSTESLVFLGNELDMDPWYHVRVVFLISLLSWPICFIFNNGVALIDQTDRPFWMMVLAFLILAAFIALTSSLSRHGDWVYYGAALFSFTCWIDLIISLEFNGIISNFMSEYLKLGEPYLACSFGSAIALFDGIGFLPMYLIIVYRITNGMSWRSMTIYWGAGILNSMVVLLVGILSGRHSPTFCTFLNLPYVVFPIFVLVRAFGNEKRPDWHPTGKTSFTLKLLDLILILGFFASICVSVAKGLAILGSNYKIITLLLAHEPALQLDDPAPYSAIQSLLYLFYYVPVQFMSMISLTGGTKPAYVWELALVHAGAALQAQFSYIAMTLDPQTPDRFQSNSKNMTFWAINLLLLIIPQLYLLRLFAHKKKVSNSKTKKAK